jgi:translocation and assembly module TamB
MPLVSRRWTRRLLLGCALLLGVIVVVFALLQTSPVATWAVRRVLPLVPLNPGYRLEVGRVSGNWVTGLQLEDVRLRHQGRELARIAILRVGYDPRRLRGAELRLRELSVYGVAATAHREAGEWDLANVLRRSADTTGGGAFAVDRLELRKVQLTAHLTPDSTLQVRDLFLRARDFVAGKIVLATIDTVGARVAPPTSTLLWLDLAARGAATPQEIRLDPLRIATDRSEIAGRLVLPRSLTNPRLSERLAVELDATPLALADLAVALPSIRPAGAVRIEARASAKGGRIATGRVTAQLDDATLRLQGSTLLGSTEAFGYGAYGEVRDLDPSRVVLAAPAGRLNGELDAELRGPALTRAAGSIGLRFSNSRLAGTMVKRLDIRADLSEGRAQVTLRGNVGAGTVSADGWVRPLDSIPSYRFSGGARRLPGTDSVIALLVGAAGDPALDLRFRVAGEGTAPETAHLSGRADLAGVRNTGDRVRLGHATISLANSRLVARPELELAGGRISGVATVRFGDTVSYEVRRGVIERVDLGRLLGDTVVAPLSGRFALRGRGVAPDQAAGSATVELDELRYGVRQLERVTAVARLDRGVARLETRGSIQGGSLTLDADARPFDSVATVTIRRASLDRVDLGTLLGRPDFAGPFTIKARGSGRLGGAVRAFRGSVVVEPSQAGRIKINAGALAAAVSGERLTYEGSVETNAGRVALAGDALPFAPIPSFGIRRGSADSLDLGTLLDRAGLETILNSRFTASASGRAMDSLQARFDLELLPSRINQAELRAGQMRLALDRGAVQGDIRVQSPDGELTTTLTGRTGAERQELRADGALILERLARWTGRDSADGRLASRFTLQASGDRDGLLTLGGGLTAAGRVGDVRLDSLQVSLRPEPGVVRVDTVWMRSNVVALDGAGGVALRAGASPDTLRVVGRARDLAPLTTLAGIDSISFDSSRVALSLTGPAWHWGLSMQAEAHQMLYGSNLAERVRLRGTGSVDSTRFSALAGDLRVEGAAFGRITVKEADISGRYDSLFALQATATLRDSVRLAAALQGVAAGDTLRGRLERLEFSEGGRSWALEQPAGLVLRPRIEIDGFAFRSGQSRLIAEGVLDRKGTSDLSLRFDRVDLESFRDLGIAPVGGGLDGWLRLTGPAATPSLTGRVRLAIRSDTREQLGRLQTDLDWTAAGLRVDAMAEPNRGGRLTVAGTLPWRFTLAPADTTAAAELLRATSDTLGLVVRADTFDLAFFDPFLPPEAAKDLRGALALDARVAGTLDLPLVNGSIRLTGAGVSLPALGVTYQKGEFAGSLANERLKVERLRLFTGGGETLTAQGSVGLKPLTNPTLDLTADLHDFRVSNSTTLRAVASGKLELKGTAETPSLTGRLQMGRTELFQGGEGPVAKVEKVELTPEDVRELARNFGPAALAHVEEAPGLVDRFHLDLDVRLPSRVWFRRHATPRIDIELSGRMQVRQDPGQPMQFFGKVEPSPNRSVLEVSGRDFRLTDGEITLGGPVDSTKLDVTAQYQVPAQGGPESEILIDVVARGRPDSLSLEFSSQPSLSQEDIISYIATGRPASDNPLAEETQSGGAGAMGKSLAVNQLSERLSNTAGEKLGLDVFQIKQDPLQGLTLTAGRYVASRLFLSLQQPLQSSRSAQVAPGSNTGPGFELEYAARRWLRANLRGGSLPPRFFLRGRYAY